MKTGYNLRSLIFFFQTSRHRDFLLKDCLSLSSHGHQRHWWQRWREATCGDRYLAVSLHTWGSAISHPPREQHRIHHISLYLKSHATNQLVHGHVSWGCGVTPKYPPESSEDGVTLEILYKKQQGMDYVSQISSKKQIRLCFSKWFL